MKDSAKDRFGTYLKKLSVFMNTLCSDEAVLRDEDFLAFIKVSIYQQEKLSLAIDKEI
jgi:hypothetical protein